MPPIDVMTGTTTQIRRLFRTRKPSGRKLRLFTVACCRADSAHITNSMCSALIDLTERVADGDGTEKALAAARTDVHRWAVAQGTITGTENVDARWIAQWGAYQAASNPARPVYGFIAHLAYRSFLLDILGPAPKRVSFDPAWRTDTAVAIARQMYDSREFGAMRILADALQDAGCEDEQVLNHCREPGPHVRGCWVCDLVLGLS